MTIIQTHFVAIRNFISMLKLFINNQVVCLLSFSTKLTLTFFFFIGGMKIVTNFPSTRLVDENIKAETGQKSWA